MRTWPGILSWTSSSIGASAMALEAECRLAQAVEDGSWRQTSSYIGTWSLRYIMRAWNPSFLNGFCRRHHNVVFRGDFGCGTRTRHFHEGATPVQNKKLFIQEHFAQHLKTIQVYTTRFFYVYKAYSSITF